MGYVQMLWKSLVLYYGKTVPWIDGGFWNEGVLVEQAGLEVIGMVQLRFHSHRNLLLPFYVHVHKDIWMRGQGYSMHNS